MIRPNRYILLFFGIITLFLFLRFFGIGQIYHQDEYRWATIADPTFDNFQGPHPPITKYLLRGAGYVFGFENLRLVPFLFGLLNLFLIFLISKKLSDNKIIAYIATFLFAINTYSQIANLQIDIDGAILPFFVLLGFYSYLNLSSVQSRTFWGAVFGLAVIGGFLTKLSFLLFIGALSAYYLWGLCGIDKIEFRKTISKIVPWIGGLLLLGIVFYYFYATRFGIVLEYAWRFKSLNFDSRAYFDLGFKIMKSLVWLSPTLLLPTIGGLFFKDIFKKYRFWFIYLFFNIIFYLVLFDFTKLTIERYFMFWIAPACLISAEIIYLFLSGAIRRRGKVASVVLVSVVAFALFSFLVLYLHPTVLPLNPKMAYLDRVKSLNFNFLIPFSGGSGPIGFYFPALFIIISWLVSAITLLLGVTLARGKFFFAILFIVFGLGYNLLLSGEYLFGFLYGSPAKIARASVDYILENKNIKEVITYNDIGAYELNLGDKYLSRFYTAPTRDYTSKLESYRGYYLIVDFPAIDKKGTYWKLIKRCPVVKEFQDKSVRSYIFDCTKI